MKTLGQFLAEAYDKDVMGSSQIRRQGEGGRVGAMRKKTEPEKRRMKAAGGGKMVPAKDYKPRKDIGTQKKTSDKVQQPTKERGSAGLSLRDQQRKAAMERRAARSGGSSTPTSAKDKEKAASKLLAKKSAKQVNPNYKPQKASGKTAAERKALTKKGERTLRDIQLKNLGKKSEKELKNPITQKEITRRNKAK
ncbi:hypothetical protein SSM2_065 [Synechococcus phage S-SM2]|uniref:Uncharacterized protein n=1 Tax=Synechococcus phage S-SM2 TaxID=444860 RepID=E3SIV9_9CAUD|nr:hypothetical protein SSM2_065 [Synechococcus phage S-SM2]ADO97407.1 hypothetical protein SSM2_065 [Synechococcus phage S-SM2]